MTNSKKIKIVTSDGKNLNISDVKDHLNLNNKKKNAVDKNNIIIPTEKKKK